MDKNATSGLRKLRKPVAVFDAGIGSYAAVEALRRRLPDQDILYLADRASFPYGAKSRSQLLSTMARTLCFLEEFDPAAILIASNAPSITVLDDLVSRVPLFGVRPPIRSAVEAVGFGTVAVLGVRSMIESHELRTYADLQAGDRRSQVRLVDASSLVDLVESGAFLAIPDKVQVEVDAFFDRLDRDGLDIAAATLSSTHLPWLRAFIERSRPDYLLFDPLDDAVAAMTPHSVSSEGRVVALVTESERYSVERFRVMLDRLGIALPVYATTF